MRPERFPPSDEVYHRIRWDPGLDESEFIIGYDAREEGVLELPFAAFQPGGDIPWHRIRYFRRGDTVVWDRQARVHLLAGS